MLCAARGPSGCAGFVSYGARVVYASCEKENSTAELVVAALLHDFGHLLHDLPDDAPDLGVDDFHEAAAESSLSRLFPPAVTEPIKLLPQGVAPADFYSSNPPPNGGGFFLVPSLPPISFNNSSSNTPLIHLFNSAYIWHNNS